MSVSKEAIDAARRLVEPNVVAGVIDDDTATFSTGGLIGDIAAALSTLPIAGVGKVTDNAERKFELWFFRDLTDTQRRMLFTLFGMPVHEITHQGSQRQVLKHVLKTLNLAPTNSSSPGKDGGQEVEADDGLALWDSITALFDETPLSRVPYPNVGAIDTASWGKGLNAGWDAAIREIMKLIAADALSASQPTSREGEK